MRYLLIALSLLFSLSACAPRKVAPPQPRYFEHEIRYEGETLGLIASWYTGSSSNWQEIADHNPGLQVNRMRLGDIVVIPEDLVSRRDPLHRKAVTTYSKKAASEPRSPENTPARESSPGEKSSGEAAPSPNQVPASVNDAQNGSIPPSGTPQEQEKQKTRDDLIDEILKE